MFWREEVSRIRFIFGRVLTPWPGFSSAAGVIFALSSSKLVCCSLVDVTAVWMLLLYAIEKDGNMLSLWLADKNPKLASLAIYWIGHISLTCSCSWVVEEVAKASLVKQEKGENLTLLEQEEFDNDYWLWAGPELHIAANWHEQFPKLKKKTIIKCSVKLPHMYKD